MSYRTIHTGTVVYLPARILPSVTVQYCTYCATISTVVGTADLYRVLSTIVLVWQYWYCRSYVHSTAQIQSTYYGLARDAKKRTLILALLLQCIHTVLLYCTGWIASQISGPSVLGKPKIRQAKMSLVQTSVLSRYKDLYCFLSFQSFH